MNKQELRKLYLNKRKDLSEAISTQFNLQIYHRFFSSLDLSFVRVLHLYLPLQKTNEPDTWMILDRIRREFPAIRISLPKMQSDGTLENLYFEGLHQLATHRLGIQEPQQGVPTPAENIDMVVVPLLAVDSTGHRIGYGKGYYDRFLRTCRPDCQKIGLSFFEVMEEKIADAGEHDIRLDACVTPTQLVQFTSLP